MAKLLIVLAVSAVISIATCYSVDRICSTVSANARDLADGQAVLAKDHDAIMRTLADVRAAAADNNRMLTFIYNMAKNQNPDLGR